MYRPELYYCCIPRKYLANSISYWNDCSFFP